MQVQVAGITSAVLLDSRSWDTGNYVGKVKKGDLGTVIFYSSHEAGSSPNLPNVLVLFGLQLGWLAEMWLKPA